jgi:hypothetical protein
MTLSQVSLIKDLQNLLYNWGPKRFDFTTVYEANSWRL